MSYNILNKNVKFQGATQGTIEDVVDTHSTQTIGGAKTITHLTGTHVRVTNDAVVLGNISASVNVSASAFYGDGSNLTNTGVTINGATQNRITTVASNTSQLDGEANLTFDGSTLTIAGAVSGSGTISGSAFYGDGSNLSGVLTTLASNGGLTSSSGILVSPITAVSKSTSMHSNDVLLIADSNNANVLRKVRAQQVANLFNPAVAVYGGDTANRVIVANGSGNIQGQANLTFNGSVLSVAGDVSGSQVVSGNIGHFVTRVEAGAISLTTAAGLAGVGLANNSGLLDVQVSGAVKIASDKIGISGSIAGNGLSFTGGADSISGLAVQLAGINSGMASGTGGIETDFSTLPSATPDSAADSLVFIDSSGDSKCTMTVFLTSIIGTGLSVFNNKIRRDPFALLSSSAEIANSHKLVYVSGSDDKTITFQNLKGEIFDSITGDVAFTSGGNSTITLGANSVQDSMINDNVATGLAGDGLAASSGVMSVQVSGAVKIASDKIGLTGSLAGNGLEFQGGVNSISALEVKVSDFMSNGANNRILTAADANTMNAESNLTFDGSLLTVAGTGSATKLRANYTGGGHTDAVFLISGSNTENLFQIMQQGNGYPTMFLAGENHSTYPGLLYNREKLANGGAISQGNVEGAAGSHTRLTVRKTSIADNTATSIVTITVPNANHAAAIRVFGLANFDNCNYAQSFSFEGSLARGSGSPVDKAFSSVTAKENAGITPNFTIAVAGSANTGANNATQTFDLQLTIDTSDGSSSNATIMIELINFNDSGITMAAS